MYYTLFSILSDFIFGAGAELTEFQELVLTQLATIGSLFVVAIPFVVVIIAVVLIIRAFL